MKIAIEINNVQHIVQQRADFDLTENKLICIAGKNGVGKTTFIRAIRNLTINSTFQETAAPYIFGSNSSIVYKVDGVESEIEFKYNKSINGIDCKKIIPEEIKSKISVELPIPHGERFNHFRRLADVDEELRSKIAIGAYTRPDELISFLEKVYGDNRFEKLKQVDLKKNTYYFILKDENERFYIREDYFSSGEYFVVNLYKQIQKRKKLIVIDEIDISLDASAQVNLVAILRDYCKKFETNIVFTTHSLALMRTLKNDELYYMEYENFGIDGVISITPRSYNFVKCVMYGFSGSDRYILTEDECLAKYINYLINTSGVSVFFQYKVIYIGGATQVVDLVRRNNEDNFLSEKENVLAVLDGDQREKSYFNDLANIILLPFLNIEIEIFRKYEDGAFGVISEIKKITNKKESDKAKNFYKQITKNRHGNGAIMSEMAIYAYLEELNKEGVESFKRGLLKFLNP